MGCLAQIAPTPVEFRVEASGPCVCNPFRTGPDLSVEMVRADCYIVKGTVLCGSTEDPEDVVENAVVFATGIVDGVRRTFAGVTNVDGKYSICLPPGVYSLEAYLCCPNCFSGTECTCCRT